MYLYCSLQWSNCMKLGCGDVFLKLAPRFHETRLSDMDGNVLYCLQWS